MHIKHIMHKHVYELTEFIVIYSSYINFDKNERLEETWERVLLYITNMQRTCLEKIAAKLVLKARNSNQNKAIIYHYIVFSYLLSRSVNVIPSWLTFIVTIVDFTLKFVDKTLLIAYFIAPSPLSPSTSMLAK